MLHNLGGSGGVSANDKLCKLLFSLATCKENGAARVTAIVPCLAYARKDRQTKAHDPVTTRYVAQLFEAMGTNRIVTLDVHNFAAFQNAFRCETIHLDTRRRRSQSVVKAASISARQRKALPTPSADAAAQMGVVRLSTSLGDDNRLR